MNKYFLTVGLAAVSLSLIGCSRSEIVYIPEGINQSKVQVHEEHFEHDVLMSSVDEAFLSNLAHHHTKFSGDKMSLVVTYDSASKNNTAMNATNKAADIVTALNGFGVSDVSMEVMPVKSSGEDAHLLISYDMYTAHAPDECDEYMPGMNGNAVDGNPDYKLGCSVDMLIARQVSKPAHLMGRGTVDHTTEGRSAANVVDRYRSGAPNESLEGEQASE